MYKPISLTLLAIVVIGLPIATVLNGGTLYIGMFGFVSGWLIAFNGIFCLWGCYCDYQIDKETKERVIPKRYIPLPHIPQSEPKQLTDNKSKQKPAI